jgi:hypothetical protein
MCRQTHESVVTRMPAARLHARAPLNLVRVHTAAIYPARACPWGCRIWPVYSESTRWTSRKQTCTRSQKQESTCSYPRERMHADGLCGKAQIAWQTRQSMAKRKSHGKARALMPTRRPRAPSRAPSAGVDHVPCCMHVPCYRGHDPRVDHVLPPQGTSCTRLLRLLVSSGGQHVVTRTCHVLLCRTSAALRAGLKTRSGSCTSSGSGIRVARAHPHIRHGLLLGPLRGLVP